MKDAAQAFAEMIAGKPLPHPPQAKTAMEGTVSRIVDSKAEVVIEEYDPGRGFGPYPFGRTDTPPQVGDKCLIVFVGAGIDRGWIVSWSVPD